MKNYEEIDLSKVKNTEKYLIDKAMSGHVIIAISVCEENNNIDDLTSYGFSQDKIISQNMTPYVDDEESGTVDIENEAQYFYTLEEFKREVKDMEKYFSGDSMNLSGEEDEAFHYEFYVSIGKCDIENICASLECEFCEEWFSDNNG